MACGTPAVYQVITTAAYTTPPVEHARHTCLVFEGPLQIRLLHALI
jgi:hypothetical protein